MLKTFAKLLVTCALLAYAVNQINFSELVLILSDFNPIYFGLAFGLQFCLSFLQSTRWRLILYDVDRPLSHFAAWRNVLIGLFFNQTLPSSVGGDAIRIYCARSIGLRFAFSSIIIDRIIALFTLTAVALGISLYFSVSKTQLPHNSVMIAAEVFAIICVICLLFSEKIFNIIGIDRYFELEKIRFFCRTLKKFYQDKTRVVSSIFLSLIIHFFVSVSAIFLFLGTGSDVSPILIGLIFALISLFSVLPISLGGWGIREGLAITLFSAVNVQNETALVVSLLFGVLMIMVGVLGGFIWLLSQGIDGENDS